MNELSPQLVNALLVGAVLSLPFKIMALWRAARADQKWWFGALLLINSIGILELTYLFYFSKPKSKD